MIFQLTNVGIASLLQALGNNQPITVASFKVGSQGGYTPTVDDTELHGTILYHGGISRSEYLGFNTVRFTLIMDQFVGTFDFSEIGLYVNDGTCLAIAVLDIPQQKEHVSGPNPGNVIEIFADIIYQNILQAVTLSFDNLTYANMGRVANVYLLPQATLLEQQFEGILNAYICGGGNERNIGGTETEVGINVYGSNDIPGTFDPPAGEYVLAFLDNINRLWQFNATHKRKFGPYTVGTQVTPMGNHWASTPPIDLTIENRPPVGAYLVQVESGSCRGLVAEMYSYDRFTNILTLTDYLTGQQLGTAPSPGDIYYIYVSDWYNSLKRSDPSISYNAINYARDVSPDANSIQLTLPWTFRTLNDGVELVVKANNPNTGDTTLTILNSEDQIINAPIKGFDQDANVVTLWEGALISNGIYQLQWNETYNAFLLLNPSEPAPVEGLIDGYYKLTNLTVDRAGRIRTIDSGEASNNTFTGDNVFQGDTTFEGDVNFEGPDPPIFKHSAIFYPDGFGFNIRFVDDSNRYGIGWSNNGDEACLVISNEGDPFGAPKACRPLCVDLVTCRVKIDGTGVGTEFGCDILLNNNCGLWSKDTGGTYRPMLRYDNGNNLTIWEGLGGFRILSPDGSRECLRIDANCNLTVAGSITTGGGANIGGDMTVGNITTRGCVYIQNDPNFYLCNHVLSFAPGNYIQYNGNINYITSGTHYFSPSIQSAGGVQSNTYGRASYGMASGDPNAWVIVSDLWNWIYGAGRAGIEDIARSQVPAMPDVAGMINAAMAGMAQTRAGICVTGGPINYYSSPFPNLCLGLICVQQIRGAGPVGVGGPLLNGGGVMVYPLGTSSTGYADGTLSITFLGNSGFQAWSPGGGGNASDGEYNYFAWGY